MKKYVKPSAEAVKFDVEDIMLTPSSPYYGGEGVIPSFPEPGIAERSLYQAYVEQSTVDAGSVLFFTW